VTTLPDKSDMDARGASVIVAGSERRNAERRTGVDRRHWKPVNRSLVAVFFVLVLVCGLAVFIGGCSAPHTYEGKAVPKRDAHNWEETKKALADLDSKDRREETQNEN